MPKLRLTGRKAALVGLSAAAATAAAVAVAAPALASPSQLTSCTDTVRVHEKPDLNSKVIGTCHPGDRVTVDGTQNGFAHLVSKNGWASLDFVKLRDSNSNSSNSDPSNSDPSNSDPSNSDNRYDRNGNRRYDDNHNQGNGGVLGGGGLLGGS
ncbi:MAG: SH3 domain-containing protein [Actinomycetota bacterium]|nr:SH3 domain-containing protein [Actinomycetota bacterium]